MERVEQWLSTWQALAVLPSPALLRLHEELVARYSESHRHYHTMQHLAECFAHWREIRPEIPNPGEVELALWFHDAVYDTQRPDNEARSAAWARDVALKFGVPADSADHIHDLVMFTRHDAEPSGTDATALVDVDLAILGAAPKRFDEYERQIRLEYHWVAEADFRAKRKAVLEGFLSRSQVYHTALFRERYEAAARANLSRSLASLT